jgi:enoyl-CoA hydratase/carnithine racemase
MPEFVSLEYPLDAVAVVTMSNPRINNNGSWLAISELAKAISEAREKGGARVCILASGVPGHWFEHAWLQDLADTLEGKPATATGSVWGFAIDEIRNPEMVVIAAISGDCSGGGLELGWACDLRIAEQQALFGQPEVQINLSTGRGGTSRLARLIGRTVAAEMVFLGLPMTAQRIHALGGINTVVPAGQALDVALRWAAILAARSPAALSTLKRTLNESEDLHLTEALVNETQLFQKVARTPAALSKMREIQARFDAGESIRAVYGEPRKET